MARLSISLLGPPRLECDNQPISVDTRKADALLAYLAVTRQQHRRDILATLLWPENDQTHARSALRRTLFTLNHALQRDWLNFDRENICLNRSSVNELAQSVLVDKLSELLTDRLYAETEGIPFFLIEYLTAIEKSVLDAGSAEWTLPGGVRDLLQSRLGSVDEIGWQLLTTAAVIGRSFDFDTLREASGRSEDATVTALEKLTREGKRMCCMICKRGANHSHPKHE
jgi:hypothetical protein